MKLFWVAILVIILYTLFLYTHIKEGIGISSDNNTKELKIGSRYLVRQKEYYTFLILNILQVKEFHII